MGFLKKITRPISRVLDKIVPNEIKPALPFLAAAAPFFGPTSAFMGTGIRRLLMGGGANLLGQLSQEGNEGEVNPLSLGLATLSAGMTDPGAASYLQGLKTPAGDFDPARTGFQKFKDQALDLGITGVDKLQGLQEAVATDGIMSKAGLKLASIPATQGAMDLGIAETRRFNKQQIIDDALGALDEGADIASRALAIRNAMESYGFTEDEILSTIESAGYRAGGRVGLKGGGMDASNPDFGGIPAAIENIKEDEEFVMIMTENGPMKVNKEAYDAMPGMFIDTTTSAYGDAGRGRPVPEFANGGRIGFDEGGMSLNAKIMEMIKEGGPKIIPSDVEMGTEGDRLDMALKMLLRDNEDNELLKYALDTAEERGTTKLDVLMDLIKSQRTRDVMAFDKGKKSLYDDISVTDLARKEGSMKDGGLMNLGGKEMDMRGGGFIPIGKKERADDVPARLSKNEFVMTADAVRAAGGGSVNKGAKRMYDLMNNLEARV